MAAALVVALAALNELCMLFPLTPLWLDRQGETRLARGPGRVRVLLTGDILLDDAAAPTLSARGLEWPFGATRQLIGSADLVVGNLEGPISPSTRPIKAKWSYNMPAAAAATLRRVGFHLITLGNNHVRDCGDLGVQETLRIVREAGLVVFGAGATEEQAGAPAVARVGGVRLAFLGYLAPSQMLDGKPFPLDHLAAEGRWGVALGRPGRYAEDVARARRQADLVIAVVHLGDRYQSGPTEAEKLYARQAIEAGADAVIGHGPHVLGPVELYRGRPILYSIGNYAFGSGNLRARYSLLAFLEIAPSPRPALREIALLPIYTMNRSPLVRYQARPLVGWKARQVLEALRGSSPAGSRLELRADPVRLVLPL